MREILFEKDDSIGDIMVKVADLLAETTGEVASIKLLDECLGADFLLKKLLESSDDDVGDRLDSEKFAREVANAIIEFRRKFAKNEQMS